MRRYLPGLLNVLFAATSLLCAAEKDSAKLAPLDLGDIAYTGGAFTQDGAHFVYALLPKDKTKASEIRAVEIASGKSESLGFAPLMKPPPKDADMFRWSLGVLGAENDLSLVYLAQYGPDEDLPNTATLVWDVKKNAAATAKSPDFESPQKAKAAGGENVTLALKELDAIAEEARKKYQPVTKLMEMLGKKELTVEIAGEKGAAAKSVKIDATAAYRELYAAAMADYPKQSFPGDSGEVLVNDSISPVARCGNWVFVHCGFYAHYGIRGRGYDRLALVNIADSRVIICDGVGSYSASGVRSGPIETAFVRSPGGKCVMAMSNNRLTLYRLPE